MDGRLEQFEGRLRVGRTREIDVAAHGAERGLERGSAQPFAPSHRELCDSVRELVRERRSGQSFAPLVLQEALQPAVHARPYVVQKRGQKCHGAGVVPKGRGC